MYVMTEYVVCVALISAVSALLFALCATFRLLQAGGVLAKRMVVRTALSLQEPAARPVGNALRQEG